jgi:hypothetical protein
MAQIEMFALNIRFLIGLLVFLVLVAAVVIGIWTGVKILIFHVRRKRAAEAERRRKFQPDGRPYPPSAPGICGDCKCVSDQVYHLPEGRRLCAKCYGVTPDGSHQEIRAERP